MAKDIETLRRVYEEERARWDDVRERERRHVRDLAALPATGAAVLALFLALRPDSDSGLVAVLYAIGLIPFVSIVVVSMGIAGPLGELQILPRRPDSLTEMDRLPEADWLEQRILTIRQAVWSAIGASPVNQRHKRTLALLQILLAIEVVYLVVVSVASPFID